MSTQNRPLNPDPAAVSLAQWRRRRYGNGNCVHEGVRLRLLSQIEVVVTPTLEEQVMPEAMTADLRPRRMEISEETQKDSKIERAKYNTSRPALIRFGLRSWRCPTHLDRLPACASRSFPSALSSRTPQRLLLDPHLLALRWIPVSPVPNDEFDGR
jgi:hypothetical protein